MTIAHVQTVDSGVGTTLPGGANPTIQVTPTAGNTLILLANWGIDTVTMNSVEDDKLNTWTPAGDAVSRTNHAMRAFVAHNVAGGLTTITMHFSGDPDGTTTFSEAYISEYSRDSGNPIVQDQYATDTQAGPSVPDSGAKVLTQATELIWGFASGDATVGVGAGFNSRDTNNGNIVEDKNVVAGGSQSAAFTNSIANWLAMMITLADPATETVGAGYPWVE
jgi:hypothetical protein